MVVRQSEAPRGRLGFFYVLEWSRRSGEVNDYLPTSSYQLYVD